MKIDLDSSNWTDSLTGSEVIRLEKFVTFATSDPELVPQLETLELTKEHGFTVSVLGEPNDFTLWEIY